MDKQNMPLGEWTLAEVKSYCSSKRECKDCIFLGDDDLCEFRNTASLWPLNEMEAKAKGAEASGKPAKSRLAEVLGVEEDEKWRYPECAGLYRVHNGEREYLDENNGWLYCDCEEDLVKIIAHPEKIIRLPWLTKSESAIMRAVGAYWVSKADGDPVWAELWDVEPKKTSGGLYHTPGVDPITRTKAKFFPSVKPGDLVEVRG